MKINNLVLQTITKVIVFLILLYAVDLFFLVTIHQAEALSAD